MKFVSAWQSVENENRVLRVGTVALLILASLLTVAIMASVNQAPVIVERSCFSKIVPPASDIATQEEIKTFVEIALKQRFDSKEHDLVYLSPKQVASRQVEQDELMRQKMKQVMLVNDVSVSHDQIEVDSDRIISYGEVRSTFRFPLRIRLETAPRTSANPYGLSLIEVEEIKLEKK